MEKEYVLEFMKITQHADNGISSLEVEEKYIKEIHDTSCELTNFANARRFKWSEICYMYPPDKLIHWHHKMEDYSSYESWLLNRKRRAENLFVLGVKEEYGENFIATVGYFLIDDLKYETIMDKLGFIKFLSLSQLRDKLDCQYYSYDTYCWMSGHHHIPSFEDDEWMSVEQCLTKLFDK